MNDRDLQEVLADLREKSGRGLVSTLSVGETRMIIDILTHNKPDVDTVWCEPNNEPLMNQCKTCKHFEPSEQSPFGHCARWHEGYSVELQSLADNEVLVENDEGWGAHVGREFGCVLHEPKQ